MTDALIKRLAAEGAITVAVRVRPHAKVTQIKEVMSDGSLKIDLAAVPEDSKANVALVWFLAGIFSVPASHIRILSGATARVKLVRISQQEPQ